MSPKRRDALIVAGVSLVSRLAVVLWAKDVIEPTADGAYYHKLAVRLAEGQGYTWLWPDGAVTYAAHYPVGYPAMLAAGYALFGAKPVVAMLINALIGAAGAVATWSLVLRASDDALQDRRLPSDPPRGARHLALGAGIAVAIHPVLVPYTAAVMTEGVTAALLVIAAAVAARGRDAGPRLGWIGLTGLVMGTATLVRPQSVALAPVLGWLMTLGRDEPAEGRRPLHRRGPVAAALVTAVALAVCAPWTARNCARMDRCALVSVNGGWNLAIGAQTESGAWQEIKVPEACKDVFQEAAKDECFGREAMKVILRRPGAWIARAPAKLRATFDYFGAAPWYLHAASPSAFPYGAKVALGSVETLASRLSLAAALVTLLRARSEGRRAASKVRKGLAVGGLVACVLVPGTLGYVALALAVVALGWRALARAPLVVPFAASVILATAGTHAVFFGAGRYGIVVVPLVTALAFVRYGQTGSCENLRARPCCSRRRRTGDRRSRAEPKGEAPGREESPSSIEHDAG